MADSRIYRASVDSMSAVGYFDVWLSNRCRYTKIRRFSQGGVEPLDFCSGINFYAMSTKRGRL